MNKINQLRVSRLWSMTWPTEHIDKNVKYMGKNSISKSLFRYGILLFNFLCHLYNFSFFLTSFCVAIFIEIKVMCLWVYVCVCVCMTVSNFQFSELKMRDYFIWVNALFLAENSLKSFSGLRCTHCLFYFSPGQSMNSHLFHQAQF